MPSFKCKCICFIFGEDGLYKCQNVVHKQHRPIFAIVCEAFIPLFHVKIGCSFTMQIETSLVKHNEEQVKTKQPMNQFRV